MSSSMPVEVHCHNNNITLVDSKCHAKRVFLMPPRKEAVVNNGNTIDWISRYQHQWLVNLQLTPFTHLGTLWLQC